MVEVPKYVDETKEIEVTKIVNVPKYDMRYVPKIKVEEVEKIRYVEKIQYVDVPVYKTVIVPTPRYKYFIQEQKVEQVNHNTNVLLSKTERPRSMAVIIHGVVMHSIMHSVMHVTIHSVMHDTVWHVSRDDI